LAHSSIDKQYCSTHNMNVGKLQRQCLKLCAAKGMQQQPYLTSQDTE